jgi:hypothetical protein
MKNPRVRRLRVRTFTAVKNSPVRRHTLPRRGNASDCQGASDAIAPGSCPSEKGLLRLCDGDASLGAAINPRRVQATCSRLWTAESLRAAQGVYWCYGLVKTCSQGGFDLLAAMQHQDTVAENTHEREIIVGVP